MLVYAQYLLASTASIASIFVILFLRGERPIWVGSSILSLSFVHIFSKLRSAQLSIFNLEVSKWPKTKGKRKKHVFMDIDIVAGLNITKNLQCCDFCRYFRIIRCIINFVSRKTIYKILHFCENKPHLFCF